MGFLDFLKKKEPEAPVDLAAVEKKIDTVTPETPIEPPKEPGDIPLPPDSMKDPTFQSETDKTAIPDILPPNAEMGLIDEPAPDQPVMEPEVPEEPEVVPPEPEMPPEPVMPDVPEAPTEPEVPDIPEEPVMPQAEMPTLDEGHHPADLPDFSEEDVQSFESVEAHQPHKDFMPPAPEETAPEPPSLPEQEVPEIHDGHKSPAFKSLEHGMFLSSEEYFDLSDSISALRKSMRASDEVVTTLVGDHGRIDKELDRIANSMNTIQERLIHIDGTLFEE